MIPKVTIESDAVQVTFSEDPVVRVEILEIVADYDLEGNPLGFEVVGFESPPWGAVLKLDAPQLKASFSPENDALAVWFEKEPCSSDQEVLEAEFGFSKQNELVFVKYKYERGAAAKRHREVRG